ncbi:hypothetical protein [Deinococcus peraridilitoris]|uniref:Uncharacterized protein n=1 Tax=Deinococcus peraridilitoris (strain DSM 19664 / LMG 22246 / CIP 109416 / KR-200) TaxID=937777 RepID=K9ZWP6_DEIPD|nr:hypothetical protein [Deinococcus peraridilitoris]AFZ66073.1 hypothetical protein Deipe_0477 [Deinococcus peraridilitoris DSM 19664]
MAEKKTQPATDAQMREVTLTTAQVLAKQEKRKVKLHQTTGAEPRLPDETVCINGHIYQIKRGESVEVPESVYEVLEQAGRV